LSPRGTTGGAIPPHTGRQVVVTGATSGLGYEIALALAEGCADVILAGRNESRGRETAARLRTLAPRALIRFEKLDLADQDSIKAFAARLSAAGHPIDLLVNNAGVMALPERKLTVDGFEMQLAVNYLGHFALTARLMPLLCLGRAPRVVQVSSLAHRFGKISFDNLHGERRYRPWSAYFQSKLAALLFARELQRRSDCHGWGLLASAAHPGWARTSLIADGPGPASAVAALSHSFARVLRQAAARGAQSALFAAGPDAVKPGAFYGPGGLLEIAGRPAEAYVSRLARDRDLAARLWQVSEQLTGVAWPPQPACGPARLRVRL